MGKITNRLAHAWNAFTDSTQRTERSPESALSLYSGETSYSSRPDRTRLRSSNERSIISSIYTRIAIDFASVNIRHVRLDEDERFAETIKSGLNDCLRVEANLDQGSRHFRQDIVLSLFDKGTIAVVPIETTINPEISGGYDISDMRVAEIEKWFPHHVRVKVYNQKTGRKESLTLDKSFVAIIENPFYLVMNEPNSTLQRLIRKLNILDAIDEQSGSGKLDIIIQLPYMIKGETKRAQAEQRRQDMEFQLQGSKYGIAYADATEKITQLNRPAENNLLKQVEFLMTTLYGQLGITEDVMNGTADEATMLNYYNRTIEPLLDAVAEEFRRKFLTKTGRSQRQSIEYYRDPFKFLTLGQMADVIDKLSRNEVATGNELRGAMGWRPSKDPKANELRNSNINPIQPAPSEPVVVPADPSMEGDRQNGSNQDR